MSIIIFKIEETIQPQVLETTDYTKMSNKDYQLTTTAEASQPAAQFNDENNMHFQRGHNNDNGGMGTQPINMTDDATGSPFISSSDDDSDFESPMYTYQQMAMRDPGHGHENVLGELPKLQIEMELWNTDLFGCCDDPRNALITACFPCVTFGQIAEIVDQGQSRCGTCGVLYTLISCCTAMPCLLSCNYRSKLRDRFKLVEAPGSDWLIHCFCECCALCQEYRELKLRGYDPDIGWLRNAARMGTTNAGTIAMTPPMQPTMMP